MKSSPFDLHLVLFRNLVEDEVYIFIFKTGLIYLKIHVILFKKSFNKNENIYDINLLSSHKLMASERKKSLLITLSENVSEITFTVPSGIKHI